MEIGESSVALKEAKHHGLAPYADIGFGALLPTLFMGVWVLTFLYTLFGGYGGGHYGGGGGWFGGLFGPMMGVGAGMHHHHHRPLHHHHPIHHPIGGGGVAHHHPIGGGVGGHHLGGGAGGHHHHVAHGGLHGGFRNNDYGYFGGGGLHRRPHGLASEDVFGRADGLVSMAVPEMAKESDFLRGFPNGSGSK